MVKKVLFIGFMLGLFLINPLILQEVQGAENDFTKVREYDERFIDIKDKWYYENIKILYEVGLTDGSTNTTFEPENNLTVAEAITFTARLKVKSKEEIECIVADNSAWYGKYIKYLQQEGLIGKEFDNRYDRPCTRSELAYLLARATDLEIKNDITLLDIPDISVTTLYSEEILELYRTGIVGGEGDLLFRGDRVITKAETSAMLSRIIDKGIRLEIEGKEIKDKTIYVSKHISRGQFITPIKDARIKNAEVSRIYDIANKEKITGIKHGWHTYGVNNQYEYDFVIDEVERAVVLAKENVMGYNPIRVTSDGLVDEEAIRRVAAGVGSKEDEEIVTAFLNKMTIMDCFGDVQKLPMSDQAKVVIEYVEIERTFDYLEKNNRADYESHNGRYDTAYDFLNKYRKHSCQGLTNIYIAIADVLGYEACGVQTSEDHIEAFILYGNTWISKGHSYTTTKFPFKIDGFETITWISRTTDNTIKSKFQY